MPQQSPQRCGDVAERLRLRWATRARSQSIRSTQTSCMLGPAAARARNSPAKPRSRQPASSSQPTAARVWIRLGSSYPSGPPSNASILFSQRITVVIVDPANTQTLYLASSADLFVSTDGGFNWTQGVAPAGDVRSLALDTTSPAGARILCRRVGESAKLSSHRFRDGRMGRSCFTA